MWKEKWLERFYAHKTPTKEIKTRVGLLQQALRDASIEVALIIQNADLFYFTGTIQRGYLIVPSHAEPIFAVTGVLDRVRQESPIKTIEPISSLNQIPDLFSKLFPSNQPKTIGLEFDVLPVSLYKRIKGLVPGSRPMDVSNIIRGIRMVKSAYEIQKIKDSAAIYADAISNLPQLLKPGLTEVALQSELIRLARRRSHFGAHRVRGFNQESYYGHVLAGPRGAVPSMVNSPTGGLGSTPAFGYGAGHWPIERNSPILIDLCFGIDGYLSDQTRTAVIGSLPPPLFSAYEKLLELKHEIEQALCPGAICEDIYLAALDKAKALDLGANFMGSGPRKARFIGHGIGLEMDEWPVIGKGFRSALAPGMVVALEPKLIFPGIGAIGLEDNYVITEQGCENITPLGESIIVC